MMSEQHYQDVISTKIKLWRYSLLMVVSDSLLIVSCTYNVISWGVYIYSRSEFFNVVLCAASTFFVFESFKEVKMVVRMLPKVGAGAEYGLPQNRYEEIGQ